MRAKRAAKIKIYSPFQTKKKTAMLGSLELVSVGLCSTDADIDSGEDDWCSFNHDHQQYA